MRGRAVQQGAEADGAPLAARTAEEPRSLAPVLDGPGEDVTLELDAVEEQFLQALSNRDVRYVLIGSHAGRLHGRRRRIKDLDVTVDNSRENAERLVAALADLHIGGVTAEQLAQPRKQVRVALFNAEILTSTSVAFEELFRDKVVVPWRGFAVPVASRVRIPLIVIAGSGIVISDSAHRDHAVGAKRR